MRPQFSDFFQALVTEVIRVQLLANFDPVVLVLFDKFAYPLVLFIRERQSANCRVQMVLPY